MSEAFALSPRPQPVDAAGRERDHVLRGRAELDPDEVRIDVRAEEAGVERVLQLPRERAVLARDHGRRRQARGDLLRDVRARENRDRTAADAGREPLAGSGSRPLHEAQDRRVARQRGHDLGEGLARNRDRDDVHVRGSSRPAGRPRPRAGRRPAGDAGSNRSPRSPRPAPRCGRRGTTSWPRSSRTRVNAVPHDPAPTTRNRMRQDRLTKSIETGHTLQAEALAQPVLDPVAIVARDEARVVHEDAEARRAHADLGAVEEVEPAPAPPARRLPSLSQLGERAVQLGRRDARDVPVEELDDAVEQPFQAAPGVRGDGDERRPLAEAPAQLAAGVLDVDRRLVPLREDDERRAVGVPRDVGDRDVLLHDPLRRVDEDEGDVGPLGRLERAQLGVVLDPLPVPPLAPQAGGVDQDEGAVAALEHGVDGVASRAGDLAHDQRARGRGAR